jgi:hypothetical protein
MKTTVDFKKMTKSEQDWIIDTWNDFGFCPSQQQKLGFIDSIRSNLGKNEISMSLSEMMSKLENKDIQKINWRAPYFEIILKNGKKCYLFIEIDFLP